MQVRYLEGDRVCVDCGVCHRQDVPVRAYGQDSDGTMALTLACPCGARWNLSMDINLNMAYVEGG